MAISLQFLYDELLTIPAHHLKDHLLRLISQDLRRGNHAAKNLAYYARPIILDERQAEAAHRESLAKQRQKREPEPMSALLEVAMKVQG